MILFKNPVSGWTRLGKQLKHKISLEFCKSYLSLVPLKTTLFSYSYIPNDS